MAYRRPSPALRGAFRQVNPAAGIAPRTVTPGTRVVDQAVQVSGSDVLTLTHGANARQRQCAIVDGGSGRR